MVESFQPPSLLKLGCFCVLNSLADHLRNISVYLENWTRDSNLRLLETVLGVSSRRGFKLKNILKLYQKKNLNKVIVYLTHAKKGWILKFLKHTLLYDPKRL